MLRHTILILLLLVLILPSEHTNARAQQAANLPLPLTFQVTQPGIITVRGADLTVAGWALNTINPTKIHVRHAGQDVMLQMNGGADGRLDPTDTIRMLVLPSASRSTSVAVYWITVEAQDGPRGSLPTILPTPYTWEQDNQYESRFATARGDRWYAAEMRAGVPFTATLTLPMTASAGSTMTLGLHNIVARTGHQLRVDSGTQTLATLAWNNTTITEPLSVTLTFPQAVVSGALPLTFTLTSVGSPTDDVLLDQISLNAVSVPAPTLATPTLTATHVADFTAGPNADQTGASFLIITHHAFTSALEPLVTAHQQRGDQVAIIDVQSIYDWASFGEQDPEAIRTLLRTAVAHWSPPPRSVLLVGAGSVNLRAQQADITQLSAAHALIHTMQTHGPISLATISDDLPIRTTYIPPYLVPADPLRGEIACDTCYTRLNPGSVLNENMPDLPIGRFPVHTLDEAQIVVAKTVQALTSPGGSAWQRRVAVLTDNDRNIDGTADSAGSFVATAETGIAAIEDNMDIQRFYYAPDRDATGPYDNDVGRLRCHLFRTLDGGSSADTRCPRNAITTQTGASLLMYVGHGSPWQWAATEPNAEVPYLWYLYDADSRHNATHLPILLSMACLTGDWANPTLMTTDERLLLHADGGIVASLSSTGEGVNTGHAQLLSGLIPQLTARTNRHSLGGAHLAGLARVQATGVNTDLLYAFGILGDPDVELPPIAGSINLPLILQQ